MKEAPILVSGVRQEKVADELQCIGVPLNENPFSPVTLKNINNDAPFSLLPIVVCYTYIIRSQLSGLLRHRLDCFQTLPSSQREDMYGCPPGSLASVVRLACELFCPYQAKKL